MSIKTARVVNQQEAYFVLRQEGPEPSYSSTECSADSSSSERRTVSNKLRLRVTPANTGG